MLFLLLFVNQSEAQVITTEKPTLPQAVSLKDNIPVSEINIPVEINLQPFFNMAEKQVDTLFTSPGYPTQWVQEGCDTRYKYAFRRSPLQFNFTNNKLTIAFVGYYKIIGSTRGCLNGTILTPWSPECKCGFEEGERRVNVSFTITPVVYKNFVIKMLVQRNEPVPIDKCTVCFWGQDITPTIMASLKKELDVTKADMEKNYGTIDLKPYVQNVWKMLNSPYPITEMGWLRIYPEKLWLSRLYGMGNRLQLTIGMAAKPVIRFENDIQPAATMPDLSNARSANGFNINVDVMLNYDSLSAILTKNIKGKEFVFSKGMIRKKFVFNSCQLMGTSTANRLIVVVNFSGTDKGTFYLTARPAYDTTTKTLAMEDVAFDVKTKDALLKTAKWLFSKRITSEIEKMARYDLSTLMNDVIIQINQQLNRELIKGVRSSGSLNNISIDVIYPREELLVLRANAKGTLSVNISGVDFGL